MEYTGIDLDGVETAWLNRKGLHEPLMVMFASKDQMRLFASVIGTMPTDELRAWCEKLFKAAEIDIVREFWK